MSRKILSLIVACLLLSSQSFALILLDDAMSKEDQKRTGIVNLTFAQKQALEQWLNQYCELRSAPKAAEQKNLYLSEIIENGTKVQLSDGSVWLVDPVDVERAALWISSGALKIVQSNNPDYPCLIVDPSTGISIKAKKLENNTKSP